MSLSKIPVGNFALLAYGNKLVLVKRSNGEGIYSTHTLGLSGDSLLGL